MEAFDIDVLLFGPLAEIAAAPKVRLSITPGTTVAGVVDGVATRFPALRGALLSVAVAVNLAYAAPSRIVTPRDEIALIPPVSGG